MEILKLVDNDDDPSSIEDGDNLGDVPERADQTINAIFCSPGFLEIFERLTEGVNDASFIAIGNLDVEYLAVWKALCGFLYKCRLTNAPPARNGAKEPTVGRDDFLDLGQFMISTVKSPCFLHS